MLPLMKNLPNYLTFLRFGLIPVFVLLLAQGAMLAATAVFIVAAVTDYFDGFIARRYGAVSDIGKLLDPLADKILVMAALVMLTAHRGEDPYEIWVPGWMVVMLLARELWVTGLRAVAAAQGLIIPAGSAGKVKSGLQMLGIVLTLLHGYTFTLLGYTVKSETVGLNLLFVSLMFSYFGAVDYTQEVVTRSKLAMDLSEPDEATQENLA